MSSTLSKHISLLHLVIGRGPRNKGNKGNGVRYTISGPCKPCKLRDIPWYSPYQNWWPYSRFLLPTVQYRISSRHRVSKIWGRQVPTHCSLWSFKVPCGDTEIYWDIDSYNKTTCVVCCQLVKLARRVANFKYSTLNDTHRSHPRYRKHNHANPGERLCCFPYLRRKVGSPATSNTWTTDPKLNSSPLKSHAWKTFAFPFGARYIFRGERLNFQGVVLGWLSTRNLAHAKIARQHCHIALNISFHMLEEKGKNCGVCSEMPNPMENPWSYTPFFPMALGNSNM